LFVSHGTPMITAGDEFGRTQRGNNNAYAQDNDMTWLDWEHADGALVDYVAALNRFRKEHPALNTDSFLTGRKRKGVKDVMWLRPDGRQLTQDDWHAEDGSVLGMFLHEAGETMLVWFNRRREEVEVKLPQQNGNAFKVILVSDDTVQISVTGDTLIVPPRCVVVLTA
jgi:glycogen debranching enzyme